MNNKQNKCTTKLQRQSTHTNRNRNKQTNKHTKILCNSIWKTKEKGNAVACPVVLALLLATLSAVSIKGKGVVTDMPWSREDEDDQAACLLLLGNVG